MIIFNLLNFPAGVVPVTRVTEDDERQLMNYTGYINDIWDRTFKEVSVTEFDSVLSMFYYFIDFLFLVHCVWE